jgi:hypothetical protein
MARAAEVDVAGWAEAVEAYFERGWTDGLPVVPATQEAIRPFLAAAGLEPGDVVLTEATRRRSISAEKIAINALMAGCRPEYMPVLLAALEAMADSAFTLHGAITSTGGSATLMVVNGRSGSARVSTLAAMSSVPAGEPTPRWGAPSGSSRSTVWGLSPACSIARRRGIRASTRTASPSSRKPIPGSPYT